MSKSDGIFLANDPLAWLKVDAQKAVTPRPAEEATPETNMMAGAEADSDMVHDSMNSLESGDAADELDLESSLQVMDVAQLKERMLACLKDNSAITLRADPGITIDAAGMQLLLAFVQQASADKVRVRWQTIPDPIREAAQLLDTPQLIQLD